MPSAVIYGGSGQLGAEVVNKFVEAGWTTVSVDFRANDKAKHSVVIKGDNQDGERVVEEIKNNNLEIDALISVAGGFAMGNIKDASIFEGTEKMLSMNLRSAIAASFVAANTLKENSLLVLTGAAGAIGPTPAMISYGVAKAATHHLITSLAHKDSGMPSGCVVTAICPVMLDTPQNRAAMPDANKDDWTPLSDVAEQLLKWAKGENRPSNGSFMKIQTTSKKTEFTLLKQ